jgi:hypothetical protein
MSKFSSHSGYFSSINFPETIQVNSRTTLNFTTISYCHTLSHSLLTLHPIIQRYVILRKCKCRKKAARNNITADIPVMAHKVRYSFRKGQCNSLSDTVHVLTSDHLFGSKARTRHRMGYKRLNNDSFLYFLT